MSGHGTWILQTNSSQVEFLGKAKCVSHSQKILPAHYPVNLAKRLTILRSFINYDLFFFAVLQLARISEATVKKKKKGKNSQVASHLKRRDKNIYFSLSSLIF